MHVRLGMVALLVTFLIACGGDDTVETIESADAGEETSSNRVVEYDTDDDAGTSKDDDPDEEPRIMHVRIRGNPELPATCTEICASEMLVCDDEYHTFIGTGGCRAAWGPIEDMLQCDNAPTPLRTSFTGNIFELEEFECYCLPRTQ